MIVALDLEMDGSGHVEAVSLRRPLDYKHSLDVFASCYDARFLSLSCYWCAIPAPAKRRKR